MTIIHFSVCIKKHNEFHIYIQNIITYVVLSVWLSHVSSMFIQMNGLRARNSITNEFNFKWTLLSMLITLTTAYVDHFFPISYCLFHKIFFKNRNKFSAVYWKWWNSFCFVVDVLSEVTSFHWKYPEMSLNDISFYPNFRNSTVAPTFETFRTSNNFRSSFTRPFENMKIFFANTRKKSD